MDWLYEVEKIVIVIVGLLMAYAEWQQAIKYRRSWVKWGLGFMGIYWAVYYIYSIVREVTGASLPTHQIFVRAGILLTLSLVASGAFLTLRELKRLRKR
jgi:hypothetical protein